MSSSASAAADINNNTGKGKQFNKSQIGSNNNQYNAHSITINELKQQNAEFISKWLPSSNPWTNHNTAREQHETGTGDWFLSDARYQRWKSIDGHLWLYGKAGCGKTILCSAVIKDLQEQFSEESHGLAIFYFSFSDNQKQSYHDLLCSVILQLGRKEQAANIIRAAQEKYGDRTPGIAELEQMVLEVIDTCDTVYVVLDALDECPTENNNRQFLLEHIASLACRATKLKLFATSRELLEIRSCMEELQSTCIGMTDSSVDNDIRRYLTARLTTDYSLRSWKETSKEAVISGITKRSHGMFRYAYLQWREIRKLDSDRPSKIEAAIDRLPLSLDDTYNRILINISEVNKYDAIRLLRWLVYAERPLTLEELAEVVIIQADKEIVEHEDRGGLQGVLTILSSLVVIIRDDESDDVSSQDSFNASASEDQHDNLTNSERIEPTTKIRLAHFSVQEYLESTRILSQAPDYHLTREAGHRHLLRDCLTYLQSYSSSKDESSCHQDLTEFPLVHYAAESWHCYGWIVEESQPEDHDLQMLTRFLASTRDVIAWLAIEQPDQRYSHFEIVNTVEPWPGIGLYYASFLGLRPVVRELLDLGFDPNSVGGKYVTALHVASFNGYIKIVELLLNNGADVNASDLEYYGHALCAAANNDHADVVRLLLDRGADINATGGYYGTAIVAAACSYSENIETLELLLDRGADTESVGTSVRIPLALVYAVQLGYHRKVKLLLNAGAGPDSKDFSETACVAACRNGHTSIVKLLLDAGADPNFHDFLSQPVIVAACRDGHTPIVKLLLDAGADPNLRGRLDNESAIVAACSRGYTSIVKLLLDAGADPISSSRNGSSIVTACSGGHTSIVKLLLDAGADVNARYYIYGSALDAAAATGQLDIIELLIKQGADVLASDRLSGRALHAAVRNGQIEAVKSLLAHNADINHQDATFGSPLQTAICFRNDEITSFLIDTGADMNQHGGQHGSALRAATYHHSSDTIALLREKGAKDDIESEQSDVPERPCRADSIVSKLSADSVDED